MGRPVKVSVVIPVYNEQATILAILKRVRAVALDKEVVVVDDGSTDATRALLHRVETEWIREFTDARTELKILFHPRNLGKGAALRTGFAQATGAIIVVQDADLEYDPAEYPRLVQPILDGLADVVYGSRFAGHPRRVLYFWHMVGNTFLTFLSNLFTDLNLTDVWTGSKVFRAEILTSISLRSAGFGFEPEFTAKVARRRLRIYEVPISYSGRTYAEGKKIGWRDGLAGIWTIVYHAVVREGRAEPAYDHLTLQRMAAHRQYNAWVWQKLDPWVGDDVLEVGSGLGTMTRFLLSRRRIIASEADPGYCEGLRQAFADFPHVEVLRLDLDDSGSPAGRVGAVDTVVCLNVLEHVREDERALSSLAGLLRPGGRILLVVPAFPSLYGSIDRAIGHRRRYGRTEIVDKLGRAGFAVERAEHFNIPGMLGWWLNSRLLRRRAVPALQSRLNDWLVPLLGWERSLRLPLGLSMLVVARRDG